jgi:phage host-nuclease inhibitor protein Gam
MDPKQLLEMTEQYKKYQEKITKIKDEYGKKMAKIQEQIDALDENVNNTTQYIETQKKKLMAQLEEVRKGMEKKVSDLVAQVEDWLETQKDRLTKEFESWLKAKLGIIE